MPLTTNPDDPELQKYRGTGADESPVEQQSKYLVLSEDERAKGFVEPVRTKYIHKNCKAETICGQAIAETYARDPRFYAGTYCCNCKMHRPLSEFTWSDGKEMDTEL